MALAAGVFLQAGSVKSAGKLLLASYLQPFGYGISSRLACGSSCVRILGSIGYPSWSSVHFRTCCGALHIAQQAVVHCRTVELHGGPTHSPPELVCPEAKRHPFPLEPFQVAVLVG